MRNIKVIRYISPLREGGSLPAIAEGDDDFLYVLKFRGAGQGLKALIADFIGGELARVLGLNMPEMVFADLAEGFGRTEPDEEIQDLLKASTGLNLGVHFLSGSITFDPEIHQIDPLVASKIVWLDALLMNIDRTAKNTNLLVWNKDIWLIDHGASLYFHHNWDSLESLAQSPFAMIKDHVLLSQANALQAAATEALSLINPGVIAKIIDMIPEEWLSLSEPERSLEEIKNGYNHFLQQRLVHSDKFVKQAIDARLAII
ncbi:aminotransferase class I and II [Taibaiella sp. KBW10]|uniref:HipA family kinase n=1 Tax=Taibaiella sp. KBW10 TaxID=2153357 RepID=UPI000F5AED65|nr:HipA family kinase [Taibaiella sp. KBW10]RQO31379.1 aminotransferase class I and II [Taibaiella sp. KBW10]